MCLIVQVAGDLRMTTHLPRRCRFRPGVAKGFRDGAATDHHYGLAVFDKHAADYSIPCFHLGVITAEPFHPVCRCRGPTICKNAGQLDYPRLLMASPQSRDKASFGIEDP